jgi:hypothetical protein
MDNTKEALILTIQQEPDNPLACYAMADLLEEEKRPKLAFAYRWMGWYDRRPGRREGKRIRLPYAWYPEHFGLQDPKEEAFFNSLPWAHLGVTVYSYAVGGYYQLYGSWEEAVDHLASGLARLRGLLEPPDGR